MPSSSSKERLVAERSALAQRKTPAGARREQPARGGDSARHRSRPTPGCDASAPSPSFPTRSVTLAVALASSVALWAALPPLGWSLLAWVAPLGWLWLFDRRQLDGRHPYRALWLAGFAFWMGTLHWLRLPHWATSFGWVALSIYLGFYLPAFVALSRVAVHRLRLPIVLVAPTVWTGLELLRGHLLGGFTMASLGHSQYLWPTIIQIADLVGAYGVSFVLMFVAACVFRVVWPSPYRRGLVPDQPAATEASETAAVDQPTPSHEPPGSTARQTAETSVAKPVAKSEAGSPVRSTTTTEPTAEQHAARAARHFTESKKRRTGPKPWLRPPQGGRFDWVPLLPLGGMLAAVLIYGVLRQRVVPGEASGPRIGLIQGSIDTELKHDPTQRDRVFREYFELSLRARSERPDLIVWPETMYRDPLIVCDPDAVLPDGATWTIADVRRAERESRRHLGEVARLLKCDLLLGIDTQHYTAHGVDRYNSAVYVRRDGTLVGRYDKTHPVMFGEYIPLADVFPWLYRIAPLAGGIRAGQRAIAFDCRSARLAANICYETVLPQVILRQVRRLARQNREPHALVNLTNSGWYWGSSELDLHLACNVFRAVECRKPLLVAANTGISAWIDGSGRIVRQGPRRATDVIVRDLHLDRRTSLYARLGDWFAGLCLAACIALATIGLTPNGWLRKRLRRNAECEGRC